MKGVGRRLVWLCAVVVAAVGCSSDTASSAKWTDQDVTFVADGLTLYGTYRHPDDGAQGPAAVLISESGQTDRNGDNVVAGKIGNMGRLAELLSERGTASLRYDKVGTGKTGLGPYARRPAEVGSAVYTAGAVAAEQFLAGQPSTAKDRISVYGLGEGTVHAMALAGDPTRAIHSLALLQPLPGRYLDLITTRVRTEIDAGVSAGAKTRQQGDQAMAQWNAAVTQARNDGTAPAQLADGLSAILNPANVKAVVEADAIDPLALAAKIPAGMPVLLTCSDTDGQASCDAVKPLVAALKQTDLTFVEFTGVNHVLRDDPTDNVANYAKDEPLSQQLVTALDAFVKK